MALQSTGACPWCGVRMDMKKRQGVFSCPVCGCTFRHNWRAWTVGIPLALAVAFGVYRIVHVGMFSAFAGAGVAIAMVSRMGLYRIISEGKEEVTAEEVELHPPESEIKDSTCNRLERLTMGDRILMGLFIPPFAGILGYLVIIVHREAASTISGAALKWVLIEFFVLCFLFLVFLFVWVVARPRWIGTLLTSTRDRLAKWLVAFFAVSLVGGAIARIALWMMGEK